MKSKGKKCLKIFIALVLSAAVLGVSLIVCINAFVVLTAKRHIITVEQAGGEQFDCIIVLGAGLWDGVPSPMLKERLDFALAVFETGCTERILMSGDHGTKDYDEVNAMKDYAIEAGVEADCIFMDHAGFSTYETMYRAKEVFGVKKAVIVTQKYHLYRAVYDARSLGIDAVGVPAEKLKYPIKNDIREAAARIKDFFWCIFKPEPTYLGEAIPISGKGSLTDDKTKI